MRKPPLTNTPKPKRNHKSTMLWGAVFGTWTAIFAMGWVHTQRPWPNSPQFKVPINLLATVGEVYFGWLAWSSTRRTQRVARDVAQHQVDMLNELRDHKAPLDPNKSVTQQLGELTSEVQQLLRDSQAKPKTPHPRKPKTD